MLLNLIGSALLILWGISHMFPVKGVVKGFGQISKDNKRILYMEWINEGLTLIFLGVLMVLVTIFGNSGDLLNYVVGLCVMVMLVAMSVLSLFTGFKINFLPYKLCPFIFSISAILIGLGTFLGI
ncbi:MAG: hypothetical protein R3232_10375 [Clostridia bacterium]|nr:hypothetical protein [Clostridia bacterium]